MTHHCVNKNKRLLLRLAMVRRSSSVDRGQCRGCSTGTVTCPTGTPNMMRGCVGVHVWMCLSVCVSVYMHVYVCMCVCAHACACIRTRMSVSLCVHVFDFLLIAATDAAKRGSSREVARPRPELASPGCLCTVQCFRGFGS